jgi:hypothetical protein
VIKPTKSKGEWKVGQFLRRLRELKKLRVDIRAGGMSVEELHVKMKHFRQTGVWIDKRIEAEKNKLKGE